MKNNASATIIVLLMILAFIIGILFGMIIFYFGMQVSIERMINTAQGMFVNNQLIINVNETKLVEELNKTIIPSLR